MDAEGPAQGDAEASAEERKELFERICAAGFAEHAERLTQVARPAAVVKYSGAIDAPIDTGASKIGGEPDLPDDLAWPKYFGTSMAFGAQTSMTFVAQLNLRELVRATRIDEFGREGLLSFFYDSERNPWGFRPSDRGSWRVILTPSERRLARRGFPPDLVSHARLRSRAVEFLRFLSIPEFGRIDYESTSRSWTLEQYGRYSDLQQAPFARFERWPRLHQCGGYPHPMQADEMERECQLVSNGIDYGNLWRKQDPRVDLLKRDAAKWRLLLQVDMDESLGIDWGLGGTTYFWIQDDDLRDHDFDHVWLVHQTH